MKHQQYKEPRHDKTNKMNVRPAKIQISLGIRPVWSESSLCTQSVVKDPSFLHADSEDADQTGQMLRLIWVFAGCTAILLVLSCCSSNVCIRGYNCCQTGIKLSKYVYLASMSVKIEDTVGIQNQDCFQNAYLMVMPAETWDTTKIKIAKIMFLSIET